MIVLSNVPTVDDLDSFVAAAGWLELAVNDSLDGCVQDSPGGLAFAEPSPENCPHGATFTRTVSSSLRLVAMSSAVTQNAPDSLHSTQFQVKNVGRELFVGPVKEFMLAGCFGETKSGGHLHTGVWGSGVKRIGPFHGQHWEAG